MIFQKSYQAMEKQIYSQLIQKGVKKDGQQTTQSTISASKNIKF